LLSMFSKVEVVVEQLTRDEIYVIGRFIPNGLFKKLAGSVGWNVIITAVK
jgi:hypothetical protein